MYPIPGGPRGTTFSSPRWTVAALVGVRLAVAGRLCRPMGSLPLAGRVPAAAVADRRAAARFDVHADRTNRCGDFWLGGCTRRSHRVARLVVRRRFTACWPRGFSLRETEDLVWGEIASNHLDGGLRRDNRSAPAGGA